MRHRPGRLTKIATLAVAATATLAHAGSAHAASGLFGSAWGKDVVQSGQPDDTGTGFEICTVAADCQSGFGGSLGGELGVPIDTAVDSAGNVYVLEIFNERIQKFDSSGNFLRTWGKDVIQSGEPGDTGTGFEICTVAEDCKAGSVGGLGGEFNSASADQLNPVEIAVDPATGDVYATDQSNLRVQKFNSNGNFLRTWGKDVIQSGEPGDTGTGFEICTVAEDCKAGTAGTLGGEFGSGLGSFLGSVDTDASGNIYVGDTGSNRVQKFSSGGTFLRTWGMDVIQSGEPADTGAGFEICTVAEDCKEGSLGGLGGEFAGVNGIATQGTNVYVVDGASTLTHRVQKFDSNGNFLRTWGKNVVQSGKPENTGTGFEICTVAADCQPGAPGTLGGEMDDPTHLATDTAGDVYLSELNNQRIQKFDSSGNFLRTWGKDVIQSGDPGDTGTGFEICTMAAACKAGIGGGLGGELRNPAGIDTNASGDLYLADSGQARIHEFADPAPPPPPPPPPEGSGGGGGTGDADPPETTITDGPKPKTKKKSATFAFSSDEPGSSFQCSFDDGPFEACTSPEQLKAGKGKHRFEVRAVDPAGNTDPTPDAQSWTVKKKKRRK